jgi:ABC-type glycerol-3-phosphate transport system substrate-binding protein
VHKRKPKKITTILYSLFLALSLSVVTGCKDGSENGGSDDPINFWAYQPSKQTDQTAYKNLIADFTAETGIKVKLLMVVKDSYNKSLNAAISSRSKPDLAYFDQPRISDYAHDDTIAKLDEYIANSAVIDNTKFFASGLATTMYKGSQYGVPLNMTTSVLFYNKDIVTTPPTSWQEWLNTPVTGHNQSLFDGIGTGGYAGWLTDPELTIAYVPDLLTADLTLYGKYVESQDTTLIFYDPNKVLSSGDVYLYTWDGDGRKITGNWPGTAMFNHGFGYYSWFFHAAYLTENVIFHDNAGNQTGDIVWEIGKNVYHQETGTWTFVSEVHHKATVYASKILEKTATCDATGAANNLNAPEWNETLANQYNDSLDPTTKAYLKTAVADSNGDLLAQAMARYDYIVKKYGTAMFSNFLDRTIPASGSPLVSNEGTNNALVMGAFIVMALVALAGFKLISKKHRYH